MEIVKMGQFISELRKQQQLTQKELAEKLHISDKAVSKWERGLSCPDISLLSALSDILGVTTTELLKGERAESGAADIETIVVSALKYGEKTGNLKIKINLNIIAASFTVLFLIGIFVVTVVDVAVSHTISWSLIPITAIIFAWIVLIPTIKLGLKGIFWSLVACSVFIAPFLFILNYAVNRLVLSDVRLFAIGICTAPISILFMWFTYFLFKKLKSRILFAVAILILVSSPISYFTNLIVSTMIDEPFTGVSLILNAFTPVIIAAILFVIEFALRKRD